MNEKLPESLTKILQPIVEAQEKIIEIIVKMLPEYYKDETKMTYKDKTFCASPNCKNACGRKITDEQRGEAQRLNMPICWGYFCGEPEENDK